MGSSTVGKWEPQIVLGLSVQILFCWIYFSLIQFWQIWENDLFKEKLNWHFKSKSHIYTHIDVQTHWFEPNEDIMAILLCMTYYKICLKISQCVVWSITILRLCSILAEMLEMFKLNSIVINCRNNWNLSICPVSFKFYCSLIESLESIYPVGLTVDDIQGYSGGSYQLHVRYDLSVSNLTHSEKDLSDCKFKMVRFIVGAPWTNPNEYWHCGLRGFLLPKRIINPSVSFS